VSGPTLGQIIRDLRARKGWTLKEMSEQSGIPVSTLSKVENGRLTLTYDKLQQMSARLKIRMSDLFAEVDPQVESITARRSIGRIDDSVRVTTPNYDYYYLCPELRRKRMIPIVTRIAAKSLNEFGDLVRHSGEEFIYVLEGSIEVHLQFYTSVVLKAGQGIYLDSAMGHAYVAKDCDSALILAICSSEHSGLDGELIDLAQREAAGHAQSSAQ